MKKIGIIDVGSNSIRVVIVKISDNLSYEIIDELKSTVRLGKDMSPDGCLNPERMTKALTALFNFKRLCISNNICEIIAVATEAVRKAKNQSEFLEMVKHELGIDIKVLTGKEEAYYDYIATANSIDLNSALLMDIGGSSTEFILMENRNIKDSISFPMGAITLTEKFYSFEGSIENKGKSLVKYINHILDSIDFLKDAKGLPLIGIGGSFRTLGKIKRNLSGYPISNQHNYTISAKDAVSICTSLKYKSQSEYRKVKGISKDRADIFIGAVYAISTTIKYIKARKLIISESGIRQGILYESLFGKQTPVSNNILDISIGNIANNLKLDQNHIERVWKFSKKIAEGISNIFENSDDTYRILKCASYLHHCGISAGFNNYGKYSFSIIKDSKICGLTHRQQLMAAFAVSNEEAVVIRKSPYFKKILSEEDIKSIQKIRAVLDTAKGLDRAMDGNITDIAILDKTDSVVLTLYFKLRPYLEIDAVSDCKYEFETAFFKKLIVDCHE